jgi:hypothetical protein
MIATLRFIFLLNLSLRLALIFAVIDLLSSFCWLRVTIRIFVADFYEKVSNLLKAAIRFYS